MPLAPAASPGGDQGARHQRRRHLQRQLRAPVREPERADATSFEIFLLLVIPVCLTRTFGTHGPQPPAGHVLVAVMGVLWAGLLAVAWFAETHPNGPAALPPARRWRARRSGSAIPARCCSRSPPPAPPPGRSTRCTTASPALGGGVTLLNMLLGEVAPGGVGTGLYGILVLAIIAVFLAGLMVGRTPEYLGKKLGRRRSPRPRSRSWRCRPWCSSGPGWHRAARHRATR